MRSSLVGTTDLASNSAEGAVDTAKFCAAAVAQTKVPREEALVYDSELLEGVIFNLDIWLGVGSKGEYPTRSVP